jgi:hypothetical protein
MSKADDIQEGGSHYKDLAIQPWKVIEENNYDYWQGEVLSYVMRDKGDYIGDLKKARHTLTKYIEILEGRKSKDWYSQVVNQDTKVDNTNGSCWGGITEGEFKERLLKEEDEILEEEWVDAYIRHVGKTGWGKIA